MSGISTTFLASRICKLASVVLAFSFFGQPAFAESKTDKSSEDRKDKDNPGYGFRVRGAGVSLGGLPSTGWDAFFRVNQAVEIGGRYQIHKSELFGSQLNTTPKRARLFGIYGRYFLSRTFTLVAPILYRKDRYAIYKSGQEEGSFEYSAVYSGLGIGNQWRFALPHGLAIVAGCDWLGYYAEVHAKVDGNASESDINGYGAMELLSIFAGLMF